MIVGYMERPLFNMKSAHKSEAARAQAVANQCVDYRGFLFAQHSFNIQTSCHRGGGINCCDQAI
jgi:hypothetical protein